MSSLLPIPIHHTTLSSLASMLPKFEISRNSRFLQTSHKGFLDNRGGNNDFEAWAYDEFDVDY